MAIAVVLTEARTVVVRSVSVVVSSVCVSATEYLSVSRSERQVISAPCSSFGIPTLEVQDTSSRTVSCQLHEQDTVASFSSSLDVSRNYEPSTVCNSEFRTSQEVVVINTNSPKVVVRAVCSTDGYPAVVCQ